MDATLDHLDGQSMQAATRGLEFLAESAEEADATGVGIRFMVDQHFEAIDAEFAITEGPGARIENGRVTFVQIAVPSRERVDEYRRMKREIDESVGRISGRFTSDGWVPVRYLYRSVPPLDLPLSPANVQPQHVPRSCRSGRR